MHGPMCEYDISRFDNELNSGRVAEFGPDDVRRVGKRRAQAGNRDFIPLIEQKSSCYWYMLISSADALDVAFPSSSASTAATVFPAAATTLKPRLTNKGNELL